MLLVVVGTVLNVAWLALPGAILAVLGAVWAMQQWHQAQVRAAVDSFVQRLDTLTADDLSTRLELPADPENRRVAEALNRFSTAWQQRWETLEGDHRDLNTLNEALSSLFISHDLQAMGEQVAAVLVAHFAYADCGVMLITEENGVIGRFGRVGHFAVTTQEILTVDGPGLVPTAVRSGQVIYVPDVRRDARYVANHAPTRSELVVPLKIDEHVIGAIDLQSPRIDAFSARDQRIVAAFAERAAIALDNARLYTLVQRHAAELEARVAERTAELNAALDQEKALNTLKLRFTSMLSHELRTPLSVIRTSNDLLARYADRITPQKHNEHTRIIALQVRRLIDMLDDLLTVLREDRVALQFAPEQIDLEALVLDIIEEQRLASADSHSFVFITDRQCRAASVDTALIRLLLNNLISNAVKYSDSNSAVRISLERLPTQDTPAQIRLRVQDEGIGIPEADRVRLFDDFHRASNVGSIPGTGLGLAVVRRIVDQHRGSVSVESVEGQGTTFTVLLPMAQPHTTRPRQQTRNRSERDTQPIIAPLRDIPTPDDAASDSSDSSST